MDWNLAGVNLNLLRAFAAVGRHCSFVRAAADLGRSQATLSMQVRELERQLGVALLERTTRKVTLTTAGGALLERLDRAFSEIAEGLAAVRTISVSRRGRIVIGCVPSISGSRLPEIVASYRRRDPTTRIDVEELTSPEVIDALIERRVDLGIAPCPTPIPPGIAVVPAVTEPLCVVVPADLARPPGQAMSLAELVSLPLIALSGAALLQTELERALKARQLDFRSRTEVRNVHTAVAMVRAGVGAAIVPRLALPDRIDDTLACLSVETPPLTRALAILTLQGQVLSPAAMRFSRHARASLIKSLAAIRLSPQGSIL